MASNRLPVEPIYIYGSTGDYEPGSVKWAHIADRPGWGIARHAYPGTPSTRRQCVVCHRGDQELAFCVGACDERGWRQQGDVCQQCAERLLGIDNRDGLPDEAYTQMS